MCFLTFICNYLFLFHSLFYYKNGDWVFHLMEVLLYQACENELTIGEAVQVCCSVVQSFLSNCCQNCASKTWSLYILMWIICYPMCMSHSMSILSGNYTYPFFSDTFVKNELCNRIINSMDLLFSNSVTYCIEQLHQVFQFVCLV